MKLSGPAEGRPSFCIFIDAICDGPIPIVHDASLIPFVYAALLAAQ